MGRGSISGFCGRCDEGGLVAVGTRAGSELPSVELHGRKRNDKDHAAGFP